MERVVPPTTQSWQLSKDQEKTTPERLLLEAIERMEAYREGRVAVHIHLSRLQQHHRKGHYLRIATETFETQVKSYAGHIFTLTNGDLFFLGKDVRQSTLMEAVDRLRLLFAEDPLAQYTNEDDERGGFASYYDFVDNYDILHQDVLIVYKSAERLRRTRETEAAKTKAGTRGKPFQPGDLTKLISILERADLTPVIRRQMACLLPEDGVPQALFEEKFVSIDDLQKVCTPDIDLLADRWLFHYLTRTLDKRVLSMLASSTMKSDVPFSLNLNVDTLLTPEFRKFDDMVPVALRGRLVIELHKNDVFSDIGAYIFARDYLHDRGYRLCLDGLTHHTLPFFDRNKLGLDLFKIYWAPEGLKTIPAANYDAVRKMISEYGEDRTILCRCESEEAVRVGRLLGIRQFQGRYIDRLYSLAKGPVPLPPKK